MANATLFRMTDDEARAMLESIRWPEGPVCVHCGSTNVGTLNGKSCRPGLKKCRACRKQFTVTVGTIFESSHISLSDWMFAFSAMCASKKGISALQLQRMLELGSYESAWFMCHRIRHAMLTKSGFLKGDVEVDETYVGGKPRKSNNQTGRNNPGGRGTKKVPVVALVERNGRVRTRVVADVTGDTLKEAIKTMVHRDSRIITDEWASYNGIARYYRGGHETVNHGSGQYARPDGINTNTVESYFALVKRGVYGSFHKVSSKHLFRYMTEFEFRWNMRHTDDRTRTIAALANAEGKRLTYKAAGNDTRLRA